MRHLLLLVSLSLFVGLLFSCSSSSTSEVNTSDSLKQNDADVSENTDSINRILKKIHAKEKNALLDVLFKKRAKAGFNAAVLVAQGGQIIYQNAFGYSDIKEKTPLTLQSQFQLASASKPLTAAGILLLKDQGKLSLNDSIQKYFPLFPYPGITIKHLLSHRSGLANYIYFCEPYCDEKNCYNGKVFDNASMLNIIINTKPDLYSKPDKKFEYCNTNYALLALIIEKVSHQSYATFMREQVFDTLGMTESFVVGDKDRVKNKTIGHSPSGKVEEEVYADDVYGDKGIYSTVGDLFKFNKTLYSEKLLKSGTIIESYAGYSNEHKGKRNYGLGWRIVDNGKAGKIIYHNGWWHGYSSLFYRRPSDETCIIVLSNKFSRMPYQIQDILTILDGKESGEEIEGE
ncbi:MAG: beta-lactamase family protein [Bacteroidetes bacterium]|nr:beta-lactamase family protein [Bacteroidota bacterium]